MNRENMEFVSISNIYEDTNCAIVVAKSTRKIPTSNKITVKYHWFRQHIEKEFATRNI